VQNNVQDVQTGLILRIQPLINDDGVIVMDIDAERSALGSDLAGTVIGTDQNGNPIRSPPINRTTAQTTISAKSGQTVVFAGLMTSTKSTTERKVPYIGDVPVLGNLFRFDSNTTQRTELLIIMTPHIIADDEDYEAIKMMESQRMTWCLGDVASLHGEVGLMSNGCLFCQNEVPVFYPDLDPFGVPPQGGDHHHEHMEPIYDDQNLQPTPIEGTPIPVPPTPVDQVDFRQPQFGPARRLPPAVPLNSQPLPRHYGPPIEVSPMVKRVQFQTTPTALPPLTATVPPARATSTSGASVR